MSEAARLAKNDLLGRVRAAARQEQFLEVVSAEEAQARFARALDLAPLAAETVVLRMRSAACSRTMWSRESMCRRSTAPMSMALHVRAADTAGASDARRDSSRSTPR